MYLPLTTYRIQFSKGFTFKKLIPVIPYLWKLGVKTIYASPIFASVPGSPHGYDGIDPNRINPEIGTLEELRQIAEELKSRGMGWMQDFVPNHMAFTPGNPWLRDFLEKGKMSFYDLYFDKNPDEPLMMPFLGEELDTILSNEELTLVFSEDRLQLRYLNSEYPLNYTAYHDILSHELLSDLSFGLLLADIDILSQQTGKDKFHEQWQQVLRDLNIILADKDILSKFRNGLELISRDQAFLKRIIDLQFYRLCYWKETDRRINYRRFFTVNDLICMNMQHKEVFDHYHQLLACLVKEDIIQAIRIDHIDGLYDPEDYLNRLRDLAGKDVYIAVEKILGKDEQLNKRWPVQGTTGYEFLSWCNNLLTDPRADSLFNEGYAEIGGATSDAERSLFRSKKYMLEKHMQGELDNLTRQFTALPCLPSVLKENVVKKVITWLLIVCPVYRYYPVRFPLAGQDKEDFELLIGLAGQYSDAMPEALQAVRKVFSGNIDEDTAGEHHDRLLHFWRRMMQLSGPLMAKGLEDTLMYNYHKFIVHNEVGDNPFASGITSEDFHRRMLQRQHDFPMSMNATATHDTKRGEDARARLQSLADNPEEWFKEVSTWLSYAKNKSYGLLQSDLYWILQVVYSSIDPAEKDEKDFRERLAAYLVKAAREAKVFSRWNDPDIDYEQKLLSFAAFAADSKTSLGRRIRKYVERKRPNSRLKSLVQLVFKCTCPGVADIYQGTEQWDYSFVDPDNRREVDFNKLAGNIGIIAGTDALQDMVRDDAMIKLFFLYRLLQLRKALPDVFSEGTYEPLRTSPGYLAFARRYGKNWILVLACISGRGEDTIYWELPDEAPLQWRDIFTGSQLSKDKLPQSFNKRLPVCVWQSVSNTAERNAGILMPLFSLPSAYGIGDMGNEAFSFIRLLARGGQRLWQLLPLNPVSAAGCYSPYAAASAFAGEISYIDPIWFADAGLLDSAAISETCTRTGSVNYEQAKSYRYDLLQKAWDCFKSGDFVQLKKDFETFRKEQAYWLDDYALYVVLKNKFGEQPWYAWPERYRGRDKLSLDRFKSLHIDLCHFQCWVQFIFFRQWECLKSFARTYNIGFIGDIPFYMSTDSADVWSHRHLFNIDISGNVTAAAGVPPDYFSASGQLWGMPTYKWDVVQQENYAWWLERLRHNISLYDKVRLDHFRAFYDYWEIPEGAHNAVKGQWKKGPQDTLFEKILKEFPDMPFVAEDLGEIHQGIFEFKDKYGLPGMRVLQFGFDHYNGALRDLPHNFNVNSLVYTGTHDNNTLVGWYKQLDDLSKENLDKYAGIKVTEENVADVFCRMAYASVARTTIIPVQDLLSLDMDARINTPATVGNNWLWRLSGENMAGSLARKLLEWVRFYNR